MVWFNRKQIKTTNGKTEKENTLRMKSDDLACNPPPRCKTQKQCANVEYQSLLLQNKL